MQKILELTNIKTIKLDNVKVNFQIKLLQWKINQLLYKYNYCYAFPYYVENFKIELCDLIRNSNLSEDKEAKELITKAKELYNIINQIKFEYTHEVFADGVDKALSYIMYKYIKSKNEQGYSTYTPTQIINLTLEIKYFKDIVTTSDFKQAYFNKTLFTKQQMDRVTNAFKLYEQLKQSVIALI